MALPRKRLPVVDLRGGLNEQEGDISPSEFRELLNLEHDSLDVLRTRKGFRLLNGAGQVTTPTGQHPPVQSIYDHRPPGGAGSVFAGTDGAIYKVDTGAGTVSRVGPGIVVAIEGAGELATQRGQETSRTIGAATYYNNYEDDLDAGTVRRPVSSWAFAADLGTMVSEFFEQAWVECLDASGGRIGQLPSNMLPPGVGMVYDSSGVLQLGHMRRYLSLEGHSGVLDGNYITAWVSGAVDPNADGFNLGGTDVNGVTAPTAWVPVLATGGSAGALDYSAVGAGTQTAMENTIRFLRVKIQLNRNPGGGLPALTESPLVQSVVMKTQGFHPSPKYRTDEEGGVFFLKRNLEANPSGVIESVFQRVTREGLIRDGHGGYFRPYANGTPGVVRFRKGYSTEFLDPGVLDLGAGTAVATKLDRGKYGVRALVLDQRPASYQKVNCGYFTKTIDLGVKCDFYAFTKTSQRESTDPVVKFYGRASDDGTTWNPMRQFFSDPTSQTLPGGAYYHRLDPVTPTAGVYLDPGRYVQLYLWGGNAISFGTTLKVADVLSSLGLVAVPQDTAGTGQMKRRWSFATLGGKCYATNGEQRLQVYNSHVFEELSLSSFQDEPGGGLDQVGYDELPQARFVKAWQGRLVLGGLGDQADAILLSEIRRPDLWDRARLFQMAAEYDSTVTALASLGPALVIFTDRDVWLLTGTHPNNFYLRRVEGAPGALGNGAVAEIPGGRVMYLARDGLRIVDGQRSTLVSEPKMRKTVGSLLETGDTDNISAATFEPLGQVWFSVPAPGGGAPEKVLVYDYRYQRWYLHDFGGDVVSFGVIRDRRGRSHDRLVSGTGDGYIRVHNSGDDDNGQEISWAVKTEALHFLHPDRLKRIRRLLLESGSIGRHSITVEGVWDEDVLGRASPNFAPRSVGDSRQVSLEEPGSTVWGTARWGEAKWQASRGFWQRVAVTGKGRRAAFRLSGTGPFRLYSYVPEYQVLRGSR